MPAAASPARILAVEAVGTFVLMIIGPGSAILAADAIGVLGVALAFGVALTIMAYAIGGVSGCHINPAVTLAMFLARKIDSARVPFYVIGQVVGALLGGLVLYVISDSGELDKTEVFAANGWGNAISSPFGQSSAIIVEIVFTALLVLVVLATSQRNFTQVMGGVTVGLTLAGIHLATIPVDNTSVNPARSIGAAVFAGGDAMGQLWVFIVFPLLGAVGGFGVWSLVTASSDDQSTPASTGPSSD